MRKVLAILLCLFISLSLSGCEAESKEKTFTGSGLSITLTEDFYEKDLVSYTNYYESLKAIVTTLKEEYTTLAALNFDENTPLDDYINAVLINNQKENSEVKESANGKYKYFNYEAEVNDKHYYYMSATYKANDAFWLVTFACLKEDKDEYEEKFIKWADSVEV